MEKKKHLLSLLLIINLCNSVYGGTFYIDPINGNINNSGSISQPWSTLEDVIQMNYIESYTYSSFPYDSTSQLILQNPSGPVKAGDTLMLLNGLHGDILIQNYINSSPILVKAMTGHTPVLKKLHVRASKKWIFDGIEISSEPYGQYINNKLVFIESHGFRGPASNISILNCNIYSSTNPWVTANDWLSNASDGIIINGDSVDVKNNTLENISMGISAKGDFIHVYENSVTNFSKDGLRILGSHSIFDGNIIKNCYKVDANHDDGIQSFTTNGIIVDNNIVRNNIIINYEDPNQPLLGQLQGIGCFDGFYNNWLVENNLIICDHWHGISFYGANNCNILNNTVIDPTPSSAIGPSWIRINPHKDGSPSTNCVVKNNISNNFVLTGSVSSNNKVLQSTNEYAQHFVDYVNYDFHLIQTSSCIDSADDNYAPLTDIEGTARPQGTNADMGCYEYPIFTTSNNSIHSENLFLVTYPNPSTGKMFVRQNISSKVTITIYQLDGKKVKELKSNSITTVIDLSDLNDGQLTLKVTDLNDPQKGLSKRIIKK